MRHSCSYEPPLPISPAASRTLPLLRRTADLVYLRATVHECIALADRLHKRAESSLEEFRAADRPEQPTTNVVQIAVARQLAVRDLEERIAALPRRIRELQAARDAALANLTAKSKGSKRGN